MPLPLSLPISRSFLFFFLSRFVLPVCQDVCFNIPRFNFQIAYLFFYSRRLWLFPCSCRQGGYWDDGTTALWFGSACKSAKTVFNFSRFLLSKQPESSFFYFSTFKLIRRSFYAPCHSRLMLPVSTCRLGCIFLRFVDSSTTMQSSMVSKHLV